jgi:hypothetical protein
MPVAFDIPVVTGIIDKRQHSWAGIDDPGDVDGANYGLAFGLAVSCVEFFMIHSAEPEEIATVIAEDVPHMRKHAKAGYSVLKNPDMPWHEHGLGHCLPLNRIAEQPMFAAKDESSILQVSDLLAFTLCRRANGNKDVDPFIREYIENVITLPSWLAAELGREGGKLMKEF